MAVFKDPPNPNRHFGGFLTELGAARTEIAALSLFHFRENRHNSIKYITYDTYMVMEKKERKYGLKE